MARRRHLWVVAAALDQTLCTSSMPTPIASLAGTVTSSPSDSTVIAESPRYVVDATLSTDVAKIVR
jgi:hypothetical protein